MSSCCFAQSWQWTLHNPSITRNDATNFNYAGYTSDEEGNSYITTFANDTFVTNNGEKKIIKPALIKINNKGEILWQARMQLYRYSTGDSKIFILKNGDILVAGFTRNYASFGSFTLPVKKDKYGNIYSYNFYAICDKNGNWKEAKVLTYSSYGGGWFTDITVDDKGNIYLMGGFGARGNIDSVFFTGGPTIWGIKNDADIFVAKFNKAGNYQWHVIRGDTYKDVITSHFGQRLALDKAGNLYASYLLDAPTDLFYDQQIFIEKLKPDGTLVFFKNLRQAPDTTIRSEKSIQVLDMLVDKANNLYICGSFSKTVNFGDGIYRIPKGKDDAYIAKYDENFNLRWVKQFGERSNTSSGFTTIIQDDSNYLYLAGSFKDSLKLNNNISIECTNGSELSFFIAKCNTDGEFKWAINPESYYSASIFSDKLSIDACGSITTYGYTFYNYYTEEKPYIKLPPYMLTTNSYSMLFLAKYNTYKLPVKLDFNCKRVSFSFTGDTAYNYFHWQFGNGTTKEGKTVNLDIKPGNKYVYTLTATCSKGCTVTSTDSFTAPNLPKAFFSLKTDKFCQYTNIQFKDSCSADTFLTGKTGTYLWLFGDGTSDTARNPQHTFTKSGNFKVSLVYSNGFCSDTFTQAQSVEILAAPKPGFTINDTIGCAPFTVKVKNNSQGAVAKYIYTFGKEFTSNGTDPAFTFTKPGIYYITQKLFGATGCITSDSIKVRIRNGILPTEKPEMLRATFIDNSTTEISWKKNPLAQYYSLYKRQQKNGLQLIQKHFPDTVYIDHTVSTAEPFSYYITSTDSCGNLSSESNIAKPIILHAENIENKYILLQATAYEKWQNGVLEYQLEMKNAIGSFIPITSSPETNYTDSLRDINNLLQQCYRLKAIENAGNKQISYSNIACEDHLPQLFIPDAFSPNGDSLNERFIIYTIGIREYSIYIYNHWGELVFSGNKNSTFWDGKFKNTNCPEGNYIYTLQARSRSGESFSRSGKITILR